MTTIPQKTQDREEGSTHILLADVLQLREAGLSTIPIKTDGSKQPPLSSWKIYQERKPTEAELKKMFGNGRKFGIALLGGRVSGNLEVLDFDEPELIDEWSALVEEAAPGLLARLPQVATPTQGLHVLFRCETIGANQKLAEREVEVPEGTKGARQRDGQWFKIETTIETRGEGGYVLTAGCPAACHPSGKTYRLINGDLRFIPTITEHEREILLDCARSFNEHMKPAPRTERDQTTKLSSGLKPGEDFNGRGDVSNLLEKHGWKYLREGRRGQLWQRPDGDHQSATLFGDGSLYVFSSNAYPFDPGRAYAPFAIYALLEHNGNYRDAAKALAREGYGHQTGKPERTAAAAVNPVAATDSDLAATDEDEQLVADDALCGDEQQNIALLAHEVWRRLEIAQAEQPSLFNYAGELVQIDGSNGARLRSVDVEHMLFMLRRLCGWYLERPRGSSIRIHADPPRKLANDMLCKELATTFVPVINKLSAVPCFAADGRFISQPGLDRASGIFITESVAMEPLPAVPSHEELRAAVDLLRNDWLGDFPLESDSDRAHAFSLILTPMVREMISGPNPAHGVVAPVPGAGKGLLVESAFSVTAPNYSLMSAPNTEEEWRKQIIASLGEGAAAILIDNVNSLRSPSLEAALTAAHFTARKLGESVNLRFPVRCAWAITGNNFSVNADTERRCIFVNLVPGVERPDERLPETFRHPNLRVWVKEHRADLLHACAVIVQNWIAKGRPAPEWSYNQRPKGSFEDWSNVIGGILAAAEIHGFLQRETDPEKRMIREAAGADYPWRVFVTAWFDQHGNNPVTAKALRGLAETAGVDLGTSDSDRAQQTKLGLGLRKRRGRIYSTIAVEGEELHFLQLQPAISSDGRADNAYKLVEMESSR